MVVVQSAFFINRNDLIINFRGSRLRILFNRAVAQNLQSKLQPTWLDTQAVVLVLSGNQNRLHY
jgi:hypothetical protein